MQVTVRFFALIRDLAGVSHMEMNFADGASVGEAADVIGGYFPKLVPLLPRIACAVNQTYVDRTTLLRDGDELALIPPVSGG